MYRPSGRSSAHPIRIGQPTRTASAATAVVEAAGRPKKSTKIPSSAWTFWSTTNATPLPSRIMRRAWLEGLPLVDHRVPALLSERHQSRVQQRVVEGAGHDPAGAEEAAKGDAAQLPVADVPGGHGGAAPLGQGRTRLGRALHVDEGHDRVGRQVLQPEDVEDDLAEVRVDTTRRAQDRDSSQCGKAWRRLSTAMAT